MKAIFVYLNIPLVSLISPDANNPSNGNENGGFNTATVFSKALANVLSGFGFRVYALYPEQGVITGNYLASTQSLSNVANAYNPFRDAIVSKLNNESTYYPLRDFLNVPAVNGDFNVMYGPSSSSKNFDKWLVSDILHLNYRWFLIPFHSIITRSQITGHFSTNRCLAQTQYNPLSADRAVIIIPRFSWWKFPTSTMGGFDFTGREAYSIDVTVLPNNIVPNASNGFSNNLYMWYNLWKTYRVAGDVGNGSVPITTDIANAAIAMWESIKNDRLGNFIRSNNDYATLKRSMYLRFDLFYGSGSVVHPNAVWKNSASPSITFDGASLATLASLAADTYNNDVFEISDASATPIVPFNDYSIPS